ncbi:hypothetical protein [Mycolicibacter longobardus]|uniref:Cullin, a subunit of E3 ubiquitin ligase n=1 Tax=Mycolicibacter longobardus TaxID=1108812 RepID=A0A1X1YTD5_9MYCO|nr:hypothetical protein [Mycolicibacter longobardus]MCV7385765.1 hypothetical protein [Mycolicibacter longobardus]ORW14290.1 hypothetical protein AWC16_02005 [Mycolicibacter longobardus]
MHVDAVALLHQAGGVATTQQLLTVMTRQQLDVQVKQGGLVRVWYGVYAAAEPDLLGRLRALDLLMRRPAVACMGTAARLYGFDVQNTTAVHVLDPGVRMRPALGLMVHQRTGAQLHSVAGRLATSPAWTAVEVARELPRPRALATLDTALRMGCCTPRELEQAVLEQRGRRGIVAVRDLLPYVDGRSGSAMESEARLVMIDYGVPTPELQYPICGRAGELWLADFAWPELMVAAEYESIDWHAGGPAMLRDRIRLGGIQDAGWISIPIIADDVRRHPALLAARIKRQLARARLAG